MKSTASFHYHLANFMKRKIGCIIEKVAEKLLYMNFTSALYLFIFFPFIEAALTEMTRYTNQCLNLSTVNILWILNQFKR